MEDRRRFSATGETISEAAAKPEPGAAEQAPEPAGPAASPPLEITFSTFILSLSTQALILLGEVANPGEPTPAADLPAAQQLIDILGMLQAKTRGNLDSAESNLLDNILYDLRMRYVQRARDSK